MRGDLHLLPIGSIGERKPMLIPMAHNLLKEVNRTQRELTHHRALIHRHIMITHQERFGNDYLQKYVKTFPTDICKITILQAFLGIVTNKNCSKTFPPSAPLPKKVLCIKGFYFFRYELGTKLSIFATKSSKSLANRWE